MKQPFGPTIARRRLVTLDGQGMRVLVSLGKPRWNGREWECPFRVRARGVSDVEFGYGVDSVQALTTALDGIRALLDQKFGALAWEGFLPDDSGFQRQIPITPFGGAFSRRLERLVDREYRNRVRQLEQRGVKRRAAARRKRKERGRAR